MVQARRKVFILRAVYVRWVSVLSPIYVDSQGCLYTGTMECCCMKAFSHMQEVTTDVRDRARGRFSTHMICNCCLGYGMSGLTPAGVNKRPEHRATAVARCCRCRACAGH